MLLRYTSWLALHGASLCCFVALVMGFTAQACASGHIDDVTKGIPECVAPVADALQCPRGIERIIIRSKSDTVKRTGGALRIRLAKKTVTLIDKRNVIGDDVITYSYVGFDRRLSSHILLVLLYEGGHCMVIHHDSGQSASPSGCPVASPDGKHFLSISFDLTARYDPNNIEIWQVATGGFRKVAEFWPEWGPSDGRWVQPVGFRINKNCVDLSGSRSPLSIPCGFAIVAPSESGWTLIE